MSASTSSLPTAARTRGRVERGRARGYTAVEVLMGLTLTAIGASAVISMQRSAIQANQDARKLDVANAISREWMERLRRDSTLWTVPNPNGLGTTNYGNAKLLVTYLPVGPAVGSAPADDPNLVTIATNTAWSFPDYYVKNPPVSGLDGMSPGFDILGRDVDTQAAGSANTAFFCVNIRLNWLIVNNLIRAEVRVFWPRLVTSGPSAGWCTAGIESVTPDTSTYHYVYTASTVRLNPAQ